MTLGIHVEYGLDLQHSTNQGGSGTDTATPFQIHQVIHSEPVAQMQTVLFHPCGQLVDTHAGVLHFAGIPNQQTLTQRCGQRVQNDDFPIRILFFQLISGDHRGLIGSG